jgi:hypothetical protein
MSPGCRRGLYLLPVLSALAANASAAQVIAVQCTIDSYRSSYAARPDLFTLQVDIDEGVIVTYYGTLPLKLTRREVRGVGSMPGGWQASLTINRRTGRFEAGTDRAQGRKYDYVALKGTCILPPELQGAGYKPAGAG